MARITVVDSATASAPYVTRRPAAPRHISSKLQEIALRSPRDLQAIEVIADMVLERLNEYDRAKPH